MGAILKGRDTDLGRDLAIKVLLDEHKHRPEVIQRFIEEAQIGGQLQHPGIAPVYELGQFKDQRPFFSMKLVKGRTLSKILAERQRPSEDRGRLLGIFEQICQTLSYAHARGVIHRDLKPSNIMVGAFGEVQVMDWGLAKVLRTGGVADETRARERHNDVSVIETQRSAGSDAPGSRGSSGSETRMGSVMGTPAYMPPEQALGETDQLDQRADVFGLGAVLCEILTGKPPYVGEDSTAVFRMARRGKLTDAFDRLEESGADDQLIELTKECLSAERTQRPEDAGVVAERVVHYLEAVESKLRESEQERAAEVARTVEQRKRLKVTAVLASVVCAVLIAGIAGTSWFAYKSKNNFTLAEARAEEERTQRLRANEAEQLARQRLEKEIAATQAAEAAVKTSRKSLFDLNTAFGLSADEENKPAEAMLWFAEAAKYADEGSDEERASLIRHEGWRGAVPRLLTAIRPIGEALAQVEYSPEGPFLATRRETGEVIVWDISSQATEVFTTSEIVDLAWHGTRSWLVTADEEGRVKITQIPSGEVLYEIERPDAISKIACEPMGQRIAICGKQIAIWNCQTGSVSSISAAIDEAKVSTVSFSQDGSKVLAYYDDDFARVFSTESTAAEPMLPPLKHLGTSFPDAPILAPKFVDGDRGVLTKVGSGDILWTNLEDGEEVKTMSLFALKPIPLPP